MRDLLLLTINAISLGKGWMIVCIINHHGSHSKITKVILLVSS